MFCKITNKKIKKVMSFGKMPIANGFIEKKNFKNEFFYKMEIGFNEQLSLFQLNDHPKPTDMFNKKYPFFSGSSNFMKTHFKNFANHLKKKYLKTGSKIIEIGSNDGTMLQNFLNSQNKILGFEPSANVAMVSKKKGIPTINEFFNTQNVQRIKNYIKQTDLIYASNVICHIPDLSNLIKSVDLLLSKNGTFVFEEPYLGSMFHKTSYDQIYDEHIYMFSVSSINKIFQLYDFNLINVEPQNTHGGSMRYYIKRCKKQNKSSNVIKFLELEKRKKIDTIEASLKFKKDCEKSKNNILNKIKKIKLSNKRICGYAATSKSTTILNYCGIGPESIDFICDTTKEKIGKYSPGMHIPIVNMRHFYESQKDYVYLFAWNHKKEIMNKEKKTKVKWFSHVS